MAWLVVLALLLALLGYLLLMPLELKADTATHRLELRVGHLARACLEDDAEEIVHVKLHVPFASFCWRPTDLMRMRMKRRRQKSKKKSRGSGITLNWIRLLRSFRVRYFSWDLDTGDPVWNAKLYPVAFLLQTRGVGVRVNFWHYNRLAFRITNRPVYLLKSIVNP